MLLYQKDAGLGLWRRVYRVEKKKREDRKRAVDRFDDFSINVLLQKWKSRILWMGRTQKSLNQGMKYSIRKVKGKAYWAWFRYSLRYRKREFSSYRGIEACRRRVSRIASRTMHDGWCLWRLYSQNSVARIEERLKKRALVWFIEKKKVSSFFEWWNWRLVESQVRKKMKQALSIMDQKNAATVLEVWRQRTSARMHKEALMENIYACCLRLMLQRLRTLSFKRWREMSVVGICEREIMESNLNYMLHRQITIALQHWLRYSMRTRLESNIIDRAYRVSLDIRIQGMFRLWRWNASHVLSNLDQEIFMLVRIWNRNTIRSTLDARQNLIVTKGLAQMQSRRVVKAFEKLMTVYKLIKRRRSLEMGVAIQGFHRSSLSLSWRRWALEIRHIRQEKVTMVIAQQLGVQNLQMAHFRTWREGAEEDRERKVVLLGVMLRIKNMEMSNAFQKWKLERSLLPYALFVLRNIRMANAFLLWRSWLVEVFLEETQHQP